MKAAFKGQGAFEYMVSYGWAILIVIVLGILLFSLGVLNPTQTPAATGFVVLRPLSWSFTGGSYSTSNVSIAMASVGGTNVILWINATELAESGTYLNNMSMKRGDSDTCYWDVINAVNDSSGNAIPVVNGSVAIPVGTVITISGNISGTNCGGLRSATYRYGVQMVTKDEYLVFRRDNGLVTGRYV